MAKRRGKSSTKGTAKKGATRRKERRSAPIRTPVEGEWLRCHKPTGQAYFLVPKDGGGSERVYLGKYHGPDGRTPNEETLQRAARFVREGMVLGAVPQKRGRVGDGITVEELARRYLARVVKRHGEGSSEAHRVRAALDAVTALYGSTPAAEFGPVALEATRTKLADTGRFNRRTLNGMVSRLRRSFKWGVRVEVVPPEVLVALGTVPDVKDGCREVRSDGEPLREPRGVRPVRVEDVEATLPRLNRQLRALVEFQRFTGCRPGEACRLRPADLDREGEVWLYRPRKHKNRHRGHGRVIYLGPRAQEVVRPFLLRPADAFCFSPREAEEERLQAREAARTTPEGHGNTRGSNVVEEPERAPGERYTSASYRRALQRAAKAAGVPRWSPNQLRHLAATEIRAQHGVEAASVILGHREITTTQVYAEHNEQLAKKVAAELG